MKPQVYLHIGTHKTGSTSIQQHLFRHTLDWQAADTCIPRIAERYLYHHGLVESWCTINERFRCGLPIEDAWNATVEKIESSGLPRAVISSEEFSNTNLNEERIEYIKDKLAAFDVTILLYLRRQDDFIESCYKEISKWIDAGDFNQYWSSLPNDSSVHMDYTNLVSLWANVFGSSSVKTHDYHLAIQHENGLVGHFAEACGLPECPNPTEATGKGNVSQSNLRASLCNYAHLPEDELPDHALNSIEELLAPHLQQHNQQITLIPEDIRQYIAQNYIAKNEQLNGHFSNYLLGENTHQAVTLDELLEVESVRNDVFARLIKLAA